MPSPLVNKINKSHRPCCTVLLLKFSVTFLFLALWTILTFLSDQLYFLNNNIFFKYKPPKWYEFLIYLICHITGNGHLVYVFPASFYSFLHTVIRLLLLLYQTILIQLPNPMDTCLCLTSNTFKQSLLSEVFFSIIFHCSFFGIPQEFALAFLLLLSSNSVLIPT